MIALLIAAKTLAFGGETWTVRPVGDGGPGPNHWSPDNVWLDKANQLHLRLQPVKGQWQAAELETQRRLGFGIYTFEIEGPVDRLDANVVFGIFNYPTPDIGPDATHEIDIEFAHWGDPAFDILNFTVWPNDAKLKQVSKTFPLKLQTKRSTYAFDWSPGRVVFTAKDGGGKVLTEQTIAGSFVSSSPMPLHFNLWCFQGKPPKDARPVEVIIRSFRYTPSSN